ncbi:MAG: MoaD/ThiS family protein [Candidatus Lokiarchaeota archaeon]|nr:MoaD/ThiS family protein [Candidatus Lokiarchaeota archaeon]
MIIVEVLYFADFKDISGKSRELFLLEKKSLRELIDLIIGKYPKIKDLILENNDNKIKNTISIAINDNITKSIDLNISLNNEDKIAFLLPFSGG